MLSRFCLAAAAILVSWSAFADVDEMPFGGQPVVYGHEPTVERTATREESSPAMPLTSLFADPVARWGDERGPRSTEGRRGRAARAGGNGRGGSGR